MAQDIPQPTIETPQSTIDTNQIKFDSNQHFYSFLKENNYGFKVTALNEENPFIEGKGFVLTDKPLLVVSVYRKGDEA